MEIIVVGGGIIGTSVAYRLVLSGASVSLLEADRLGGGTSGTSFAWINSNDKAPFEYHVLNTSGMAEHVVLTQELELASWLHMSGNVEWATGDAAGAKLREKVTHLRGWGYPVELLAKEEVRSLEPDVVPPDDVSGIAFYPSEGFVDVPPLLGALARTAQAAGARIHAGTRVIDLVRTGERVTGVVTSDGTRLTSDWVVSCVGHRTGQFARLVGLDLPVARSVGLLAISQASTVQLRTIVHSPLVNLRPDGAGRIMMRANEFDRDVQEDTPLLPFPQACGVLLERAVRILPRLAGSPIETARIGVRPLPEDGFPLVGPVPGTQGLYVVCTHSGVTLGPLLGRIAAREILTGQVDPRIASFRLSRLKETRHHA